MYKEQRNRICQVVLAETDREGTAVQMVDRVETDLAEMDRVEMDQMRVEATVLQEPHPIKEKMDDSLGQNGGTNGPPGAPPNGEGGETEGGVGQAGQYPNADGENADPNNMNQAPGGDGGAGGQTPDGQAGNQAGDQGGQQGGPPPGPVEGQLLIKVDKENNTEPQYTQEDLGSKSNVTFSGVVKCDGCKGDLVLRATSSSVKMINLQKIW